jgi:hypothetical protein
MKKPVIVGIATGALLVVIVLGAGSTSSSPGAITITTLAELQDVNNDLSGDYLLAADIDASATAGWNGGEGFVPIGAPGNPFTGTFDGQGHVISNLRINRPGFSYQGLFGKIMTPPGSSERTVVEQLRLADAEVNCGGTSGTLVGRVADAIVRGCSASGTLTVTPDGASDAKSGGLIGAVSPGSTIGGCSSEVDVTSGLRQQVGGLIGYLRGVEDFTILRNSYSTGTVSGTGWKVGGLLGDADGSHVDCCYSVDALHALIGFNYRDPVITRSYWDADVGPSSSPWGGTPKTTAEMMLQSTYVEWDFVSTWQIIDTQTYPWLQTLVPVELMRFTVD